MTFKRTNNGYSNLYLFTGTDAVVLVEGGDSYSKDAVYTDQYNVTSVDSNFWQAVFKRFLPNRALNFRAVGSKGTLQEIAEDIKIGAVKRTLVAMDRDFDDRTNQIISAPEVFYTHGYSWENDVWVAAVIEQAIRMCTPVPANTLLRPEIDTMYQAFERCIKSAVRCDAQLSTQSCSVIPRKGPGVLLDHGHGRIHRDQIAKLLKTARASGYKHQNGDSADVSKDCYGHLLGMFAREIIECFHKKFAGQRTNMRHLALDCIGISQFSQLVDSPEFASIRNHHKNQVERLPQAFFEASA